MGLQDARPPSGKALLRRRGIPGGHPSQYDAVLVATLPPGPYTVRLSGVNDTMGIGLVEVYELP